MAATNAIAAGADVKLVQLMFGHKDATETLNTYSHLWPNRVDEVIGAVERRRATALALGQLRAIYPARGFPCETHVRRALPGRRAGIKSPGGPRVSAVLRGLSVGCWHNPLWQGYVRRT
ncbi:hypothetical protein C6C15_10850 [Microbacterium sp. str. 'China']|nr:hypothetical protein C6C15_10850 [Microbacterium sp. str. 'China']